MISYTARNDTITQFCFVRIVRAISLRRPRTIVYTRTLSVNWSLRLEGEPSKSQTKHHRTATLSVYWPFPVNWHASMQTTID